MAFPTRCRACNHKFQRKGHYKCPACGHDLPRYIPGKKPQPEPEETPVPQPEPNLFEEWDVENPLYRCHVSYMPPKNYRVTFENFMVTWVYCPKQDCQKKLFQNMGIQGVAQHRCPRCGSDIEFMFIRAGLH